MVYSEIDRCWYRGRVEQLDPMPGLNKIRVLSLDFGWNKYYKKELLYQPPADLAGLPVRCEKYRMTDVRPRGQADGYSMADRLAGGEWLRRLINKRVVVAICHEQVSYSGGILADCMVGDTNLNRAALMQGHVIGVYKAGGGGPPFAAAAASRFPPSNHYQPAGVNGGPLTQLDLDYTAYNGKLGAGGRGGSGDGPPMSAAGRAGLRPGIMGGVKPPNVKKLEKIISNDKKTISQLKKTTNLDAGIKAGGSLYLHFVPQKGCL